MAVLAPAHIGENARRQAPSLVRAGPSDASPVPVARPATLTILAVDVAGKGVPVQVALPALEVLVANHLIAAHVLAVGGAKTPSDPTALPLTFLPRQVVRGHATPTKDAAFVPVGVPTGKVVPSPDRPCEAVVVQVVRVATPRPLETRTKATNVAKVPVPALDVPRPGLEALTTIQVVMVVPRPVAVVDHAAALLLPVQEVLLDEGRRLPVTKVRDEAVVAIPPVLVTVEEARQAVAVLVGQVARVRRRLAATARADPAVAAQVEAPADDAFPVVGPIPEARAIDVAVVRVARRPLAVRPTTPGVAEATVQTVALVGTQDGVVGVGLVTGGVEKTWTTFLTVEGQTTA